MIDYKPRLDEEAKEPEYEDVGWRNRIIGYAEVDPRSLLANEDNWRTHPMYQREVVGTALEQIGWVQDVVVNVRQHEDWDDASRGIETVVDGHLRVLLALQTDQPSVPVKYVDLTPEEEKAVLLVLDPSSSLATADKGRLKELLANAKPVNEATRQLLIDLAERHRIAFDEEDILTSEDEFGDFSEYGAEGEGDFVDFKFGDYSAKISKPVYDIFVQQVNKSKEQTGEVMLDNVIQGWFEPSQDTFIHRSMITPLPSINELKEMEDEVQEQEYWPEPVADADDDPDEEERIQLP